MYSQSHCSALDSFKTVSTLVRHQLKYAAAVWSLLLDKDTVEIEKVNHRAALSAI